MINNSGSVPNTEEGTCILFGVGCTPGYYKLGHAQLSISIIQRFDKHTCVYSTIHTYLLIPIHYIHTCTTYYIHTLLIPGVDKIGTIH